MDIVNVFNYLKMNMGIIKYEYYVNSFMIFL